MSNYIHYLVCDKKDYKCTLENLFNKSLRELYHGIYCDKNDDYLNLDIFVVPKFFTFKTKMEVNLETCNRLTIIDERKNDSDNVIFVEDLTKLDLIFDKYRKVLNIYMKQKNGQEIKLIYNTNFVKLYAGLQSRKKSKIIEIMKGI